MGDGAGAELFCGGGQEWELPRGFGKVVYDGGGCESYSNINVAPHPRTPSYQFPG